MTEVIKEFFDDVKEWKEAMYSEINNPLVKDKETWNPESSAVLRTIIPLPMHVLLKIKRKHFEDHQNAKLVSLQEEVYRFKDKALYNVYNSVADITLVLLFISIS